MAINYLKAHGQFSFNGHYFHAFCMFIFVHCFMIQRLVLPLVSHLVALMASKTLAGLLLKKAPC